MNDELGTLTLQNRPHATRADDKCMSELVDWMAGKSDSNLPACVSPVLADFGKAWKEGMRSDEEREQLREYVPLLVGTASANVDLTRSRMAFIGGLPPAIWSRVRAVAKPSATLFPRRRISSANC